MSVIPKEQVAEAAKAVAYAHHLKITRRDKVTPYISHVCDVRNRVVARYGPNRVLEAIAWLHDVVEDRDFNGNYLSIQNLLNMGFPSRVTNAVKLLTHNGTTCPSYDDYVRRIKENPDAAAVKLEDNLSNLSDKPTLNQIRKYAGSLAILVGPAGEKPLTWSPPYHNPITSKHMIPGAPATCPDCKVDLTAEVLHSNAGYYIGMSYCKCGPYSRESGYYSTREEAQINLNAGTYTR